MIHEQREVHAIAWERAIRVWPWPDAPERFRALSSHGGDEDWVAFVPTEFCTDYIPWLAPGTPFGVCDVSEHHITGGVVYIGAHS